VIVPTPGLADPVRGHGARVVDVVFGAVRDASRGAEVRSRVRAELRDTYRLQNLRSPEALWNGLRGHIRREIRKARTQLEIRDDLGLDGSMPSGRRRSRGRGSSLSVYVAARAAGRCVPPSQRSGDAVRAGRRQPRACRHLRGVGFDTRPTTFSVAPIRSSARPAPAACSCGRRSCARAVTDIFDFEGSMLKPVERFFAPSAARRRRICA